MAEEHERRPNERKWNRRSRSTAGNGTTTASLHWQLSSSTHSLTHFHTHSLVPSVHSILSSAVVFTHPRVEMRAVGVYRVQV